MGKVKVTLTKSLIGVKPNQSITAKSLGLKVVSHLVKVEAAE